MAIHDSIILRGGIFGGKSAFGAHRHLTAGWRLTGRECSPGASRRTTTTDVDGDGDGAGDGGDDRSRGCRRGGGVRRRCGMRDDDDARWMDE